MRGDWGLGTGLKAVAGFELLHGMRESFESCGNRRRLLFGILFSAKKTA
jgi:hypothetical protein